MHFFLLDFTRHHMQITTTPTTFLKSDPLSFDTVVTYVKIFVNFHGL